MEAAVLNVVSTINSYLSNYVLLILLIGTGLFFTIRTRFVQFRCFGEGWKKMFGEFSLAGGDQGGAMSSFQAVATAVAAQVGTGNIVGACGAILIGGPGAIFWMWIIALLGMSTNYAEAVLAQKTKVIDKDGQTHGGPVYYITTAFKGSGGKALAVFFSIAVIIALGFIGPMVQSNSIGETMNHAFNIPTWLIGLFVAVFAGFIFVGNLHRLASVTEKLVPIMAVLYVCGSLVVLVMNGSHVPEAFGLIFQCAFNPAAGLGGAFFGIWAAVTQGAKRGLFSNEAGMGSTPHAHAQANVAKPHDQGVVAMIGVFIDTFIVLTLNALVIISTLYTPDGILANGYSETSVNAAGEAIVKSNLAQTAFSSVFGQGFGNAFVAICLFFFAFSTVLSWNMFGKINVIYLFGKKYVRVYEVIALVFIFLGTLASNDLVWELSDMFNQLMVIPNAVALLALTGMVVTTVKKHSQRA